MMNTNIMKRKNTTYTQREDNITNNKINQVSQGKEEKYHIKYVTNEQVFGIIFSKLIRGGKYRISETVLFRLFDDVKVYLNAKGIILYGNQNDIQDIVHMYDDIFEIIRFSNIFTLRERVINKILKDNYKESILYRLRYYFIEGIPKGLAMGISRRIGMGLKAYGCINSYFVDDDAI